jgi:hypothetical protein
LPAGEFFTREIRSGEPPEDLHWRVVAQLSPLLAPMHYKLATQDPQHVEYSRRYVPAWQLVAALVALGLVGGASALGGLQPLVVLGGAVVGAALLSVRRSEALTIAVHPRPGGSIAFVRGFLTARARMALLGFDPPRRSRVMFTPDHHAHAERLPEQPPVG